MRKAKKIIKKIKVQTVLRIRSTLFNIVALYGFKLHKVIAGNGAESKINKICLN